MNQFHLYKAHNFSNRVNEVVGESSITEVLPGAYYTEGQSVNESKAIKTAWNTAFFSNGIVDKEIIYGKGKRTELRHILNMRVNELAMNPSKFYGGVGQQGFLINDFQRMTLYNKLTDDYGWYDLGDALLGDVVYAKSDTSYTQRFNYNIPSDDKIVAFKNAGIMDKDGVVHGAYSKFKVQYPIKLTWNPTGGNGSHVCSSFWYRRAKITDINAYQDWHSMIWVKKPGEDLQINRRGKGRNFLVPFNTINILNPDYRKNVVVDSGRPIALESPLINVRKEDSALILHVHQINTNT